MASLKRTERRQKFFKSFEAKSLASRSFLTQIADDLTAICGSTPFLIIHVVIFAAWIIINLGYVRQISVFDPFPFGLLTMVVSLEAIFLSIFVLVSQNRSSYISTLRDEVHLGVNLIAEEEITKILEILTEIKKELGIKKPDPQLEKMLERIDTGYIERSIMKQMDNASSSLVNKMLEELPDPIAHPKTILKGNGNSSTETKNDSVDDDLI